MRPTLIEQLTAFRIFRCLDCRQVGWSGLFLVELHGQSPWLSAAGVKTAQKVKLKPSIPP
jgi:hypothetical protein